MRIINCAQTQIEKLETSMYLLRTASPLNPSFPPLSGHTKPLWRMNLWKDNVEWLGISGGNIFRRKGLSGWGTSSTKKLRGSVGPPST